MRKIEGGEEMNHVNHIFRGNTIKFFPESRWLSQSNIIREGVKNA